MRKYNKSAMRKLWAWLSLGINVIISAIIYVIFTKTKHALVTGVIVGILCFLFGLIKTHRDIVVNDLGISSTAISYVCSLLLSAMLIYFVGLYTSIFAMLFLLSVVLAECVIVFLISKKGD